MLSDYKCYCGVFTPFSGKMKKSIKIFSYPEIVDKNLGFIQKKEGFEKNWTFLVK
ncbi:hypothetical protein RV02_GL000456 [Enterococcus gilvus]|nr:hypothetical protein RV02_GL000456 [Enterococcus gilvus]